MINHPPEKPFKKTVQNLVQKMVQKIVQKVVQKIVQKIVQRSKGPVHILPYACAVFWFLSSGYNSTQRRKLKS